MIVGLTRGASRAHVARAALEAIAYQVRDVAAAMTRGPQASLSEIRADGGGAGNDFLLQFQADITGVPVLRAATLEATALGAAHLAGLGVGMWRTVDELAALIRAPQRFEPAMEAARREELLQGWERAVQAALAWARTPGGR